MTLRQQCGKEPRFKWTDNYAEWNVCANFYNNRVQTADRIQSSGSAVPIDLQRYVTPPPPPNQQTAPKPPINPQIFSTDPPKAAKQDFQKLLMFAALGIGGFLAYKYLIMKKAKK